MTEKNQTESEHLYDDLIGKPDEEETLTSEEIKQAEQAKSFAEYTSKIEALDVQLAEYHTERLTNMRRQAMKESNYTLEQVERYISHIEGNTIDEVEQSVAELSEEIPASGHLGVDANLMNGAKNMPKANFYERAFHHGKDAAKRLLKGGQIR